MQSTQSFPLKWPFGRERTKDYQRQKSTFKTPESKSTSELIRQLKLMGASNVVISTNLATYERNGIQIPYVDQKKMQEDPGAAVYFTWKGEQYAFACDKWKNVYDNIQALNKTVEAIRGLERWGTGDMVKAAFSGFKEIGEPAAGPDCWSVLGIPKTKSVAAINEAYRAMAPRCHPDTGGSTAAMQHLNDARAKAMEYASNPHL